MYEIQKGVPIPTENLLPRYERYPFGQMNVGDSFVFDSKKYKNTYSAAQQYKKRKGVTFLIRSNRDGTCTCWRTA